MTLRDFDDGKLVFWVSMMVDRYERAQELLRQLFDLPSHLEEIGQLEIDSEAIVQLRVDIEMFSDGVWSLTPLSRLRDSSKDELVRYLKWVNKSFFERFSKNKSIKQLISIERTPILFEKLRMNEELRCLIKAELEEIR